VEPKSLSSVHVLVSSESHAADSPFRCSRDWDFQPIASTLAMTPCEPMARASRVEASPASCRMILKNGESVESRCTFSVPPSRRDSEVHDIARNSQQFRKTRTRSAPACHAIVSLVLGSIFTTMPVLDLFGIRTLENSFVCLEFLLC